MFGKILQLECKTMQEFWELAYMLYEKWKEYSFARANREMLDNSKKSVLAKEWSQYEWSEAYRERMAYKSDAYKVWLKWYQDALQKELELKYLIDSLNMQHEYYRSMNSVKKKEMNIL